MTTGACQWPMGGAAEGSSTGEPPAGSEEAVEARPTWMAPPLTLGTDALALSPSDACCGGGTAQGTSGGENTKEPDKQCYKRSIHTRAHTHTHTHTHQCGGGHEGQGHGGRLAFAFVGECGKGLRGVGQVEEMHVIVVPGPAAVAPKHQQPPLTVHREGGVDVPVLGRGGGRDGALVPRHLSQWEGMAVQRARLRWDGRTTDARAHKHGPRTR